MGALRFTDYFLATRTRPDHVMIRDEWHRLAIISHRRKPRIMRIKRIIWLAFHQYLTEFPDRLSLHYLLAREGIGSIERDSYY